MGVDTLTVPASFKCEDAPDCDGLATHFCADTSISKRCPVLCDSCQPYWEEWNEWTECSTSCRGTGTQGRTRDCIQVREEIEECTGPGQELRQCPDLDICFDEWSNWTECSVSRGNGTISRQRVCSEPDDCEWVDEEEDYCVGACVGEWVEWGEWSACDVTCGSGNLTRTRSCPDGL